MCFCVLASPVLMVTTLPSTCMFIYRYKIFDSIFIHVLFYTHILFVSLYGSPRSLLLILFLQLVLLNVRHSFSNSLSFDPFFSLDLSSTFSYLCILPFYSKRRRYFVSHPPKLRILSTLYFLGLILYKTL